MRERPTVGQTLYSLNVNNSARGRKQELTPVKVTAVAKKYFSVKTIGMPAFFPATQYHLDTWKEKNEFSVDTVLYVSAEEWENEKECEAICNWLWQKPFNYGRNVLNLPLAKLRQIKAIVNS